MRKKEVNLIMKQICEVMEKNLLEYGFVQDGKSKRNFHKGFITYYFYPRSVRDDSFKLKTGFGVKFPFFEELAILMNTEGIEILDTGNYSIDSRLAHIIDVHDFDLCEESYYNPHTRRFALTVFASNDVLVTTDRLMELLESFGFEIMEKFQNLDSAYETMKNIIGRLVDDNKNLPEKDILERPLALHPNGFDSFVYLAYKRNDPEGQALADLSVEIVSNNHPYDVGRVRKIKEYFKGKV